MDAKQVTDLRKVAEAQAQAQAFEQKVSKIIGNLMLDNMKKQSSLENLQLENASLKKELSIVKSELELLKTEASGKAS